MPFTNQQINPKLLSRIFSRSRASSYRDIQKIRKWYGITERFWLTPAEVAEYYKMTLVEVIDAIEALYAK